LRDIDDILLRVLLRGRTMGEYSICQLFFINMTKIYLMIFLLLEWSNTLNEHVIGNFVIKVYIMNIFLKKCVYTKKKRGSDTNGKNIDYVVHKVKNQPFEAWQLTIKVYFSM
jgi:hypothetical protein